MADAGVPVLGELDPGQIAADRLPVLVKASAGGGGRGMRVVRDLDSLQQQVAAASAEAASAFGDATVFCEPYVEQGRHVEMQVLADAHGNVWVLGERDCSVQRRHQKVVEESPSPAVDAALRAELTAAAESAAKAVGYVGAGTVEFLVDDARTGGSAPRVPPGPAFGDAPGQSRFWFLEMNTRLQVEHPVTECVYGTDLVALQLAVAEGQTLDGSPPEPRGHAIEVRLYAEDPAEDWLAQSGVVHRFAVPGVDARFDVPSAHGLRLDSGVESGTVVSPHYDAMLAKVVAWAPTRATAARRLAGALRGAQVHGITTNRDLLLGVLEDAEFLAGRATTAFLSTETVARLARSPGQESHARLGALAAALADARTRHSRVAPPAWRNVPSQPVEKRYLVDGTEVVARYRSERGRLAPCDPEVEIVHVAPDHVVLRVADVDERLDVQVYDDGTVAVDSAHAHVDLRRVPRFTDPEQQVDAGSLLAPMPASVVSVAVAEGDAVRAGDPIVVLEAMKMQHTIRAHEPGVVTSLPAQAGRQVDSGAVLAVVTPEGEQP